jgi:hypothetical protein
MTGSCLSERILVDRSWLGRRGGIGVALPSGGFTIVKARIKTSNTSFTDINKDLPFIIAHTALQTTRSICGYQDQFAISLVML